MIQMIYWFLPGILILGLITSYTDFKTGKIKNKHIILALLYTFLVYIFLVFYYKEISIGYFIELVIMLFLTLFIGFMIWYIGLWTAGDAKLFLAYSALIPLSVYKYGYMPYFSSVNILINTFIPFALFLSLILLFRTNQKQKIICLKKIFKPQQLFSISIFLFAFIWIIDVIFSIIKIRKDYFVMVFLLFVIMLIFDKLALNKIKIIGLIAILRFIFDKTVYSLASFKFFLFLLIVFIFIRFFLLNLGFLTFTKQVDIKSLKQGMVPAEAIFRENNKYKKHALLHFSLLAYLEEKTKKKDYIFELTAEGLTKKDIINLKKLKLPFKRLRVQQTISFAFSMFLGALLTIIMKGNVLIIIRLLF